MIDSLLRPKQLHPIQRWVVVLWIILLIGVTIRIYVTSVRSNTVFPIYIAASERWIEGKDLYAPAPPLDVFRYPPITAVLFSPFTLLPERLAGLLWRGMSVALFLTGFWQFLRCFVTTRFTPSQIGWLFGLTIPLVLQSLNNAQVNVLLIGLLLWGVCSVQQRYWWSAAFFLALATLFKVYPIALGALLTLIYPRIFGVRYFLMIFTGIATPFLFQNPEYVLDQYHGWIRHLGEDNNRFWASLDRTHRDLFMMLRVWGIPPTESLYRYIQLSAGIGIAIFTYFIHRFVSKETFLLTIFHLSCVWMTLFGPATESCTYTILAPTLALCLIEGFSTKSFPLKCLVAIAYGMFVLPVLAMMFPQGKQVEWLGIQPLGACLCLIAILIWFNQENRVRQHVEVRKRYVIRSIPPEYVLPGEA